MNARNYWIGVVSRAHAHAAIAAGFVEVNRGKAGPLERMRDGDGYAIYSPRTDDQDGDRLQAFTAIGRVTDAAIVQARPSDGPARFRRGVHYLSADEAPVKPLIESLSFIRSKIHWGAPFRYGFIKIPEFDFAQIAAAMGRNFDDDFPHVASASPALESEPVPA